MSEQSRITEHLANRIGQQIAGAQNAAQRDKTGKSVLNSQQTDHALDLVNDERVHDKTQSMQKNQELLDRVHISPEAQALYRAHESGMTQTPERAHERAQNKPETGTPDSPVLSTSEL